QIKKALEPYGFTCISQLNFVNDRDSNFIKALQPYSPINRVRHRLNSVINSCFYQTGKIKRKTDNDIPNEALELIYSSDSDDDTDNYDRYAFVVSSFGYDLADVDLIDISSSANNTLKSIPFFKTLMKFLRKKIYWPPNSNNLCPLEYSL
ncbi:unnamed protein product, partial [Rotaria sp. Silwood2]